MRERQRFVATGLTLLMGFVWVGFLFHSSPRFAGSLAGGLLGVSGGLLMLVPLAYLIVKRTKWLKSRIVKHVPMRTLLAWHVYAGIVGPILVLLHTGHKFVSPLGIALTAMTLVVVLSGFIGLYVMKQLSTEIREKKAILSGLREAHAQAASEFASHPERADMLRPFSGLAGRLVASLFVHDGTAAGVSSAVTVIGLSNSIVDVEYSIKMHETFKRWFGRWLKFHIGISCVLYVLLGLHVWAAIHFGLRWFPLPDMFWGERPAVVHTEPESLPLLPLMPTIEPIERGIAVDEFSEAFGRMFRRAWRAPVLVHGIPTTVFDFAGVAAEAGQPGSDFQLALAALKRVDPGRLGGGNREKAFWINVYNFGAMKLVAENYPVTSITDAKISSGNPWAIPGIQVGEELYTLRLIETEVLLKTFDDPRIVFAVSCAAVSCPDRDNEIFTAGGLDEQLDDVIRTLFANSKKGLAIDRQDENVTLSWILTADRKLFGDGSDDALLDFVRRYVSADTRAWLDETRDRLRVGSFDHDWGLNDIALADGEN